MFLSFIVSICRFLLTANAVTSKMLLGSAVFTILSHLVEAMEGLMFNSVMLKRSNASANDKLCTEFVLLNHRRRKLKAVVM